MTSKVLLCLARSYIKNSWVQNKSIQLTRACQEWLSDQSYDLVEVDNFVEINNYTKDYDWILVQAAGDIIVDRDYFRNKLENIDPDVGLMAHILWYKDEDNCPYIHHQCFIINCKAVKNTVSFINKSDTGKSFIRSDEDLHDGHAPLTVDYGSNIIKRNKKFGTDLIIEVLNNGYEVRNFDISWRFNLERNKEDYQWLLDRFNFPGLPTRGYIWPELESDHYETALKNLESNEFLDSLQDAVIKLFRNLLNYNDLNILHWDKFPIIDNFNSVISPANGFLAEAMCLHSGAKKIVFYDTNKNNVEFKKYLYEKWDGIDYFKFAHQYAANNKLKTEPSTENGIEESSKSIADLDRIFQNWSYLKSIEKEFLHIDIIKDCDRILSKIEDRSILHTSTIFGYYLQSNILHDQDIIDLSRKKIKQRIEETDSKWIQTK